MPKTFSSYGEANEAVAAALEAANRARLDDPDEHFPYQRDVALAALEKGPEPGTNNHPEHWYTSQDIIEATAAYVEAQAAYLADPSKRDAERLAAEALRDARQRHRQGRPAAPVAVAGNPAEIEQRRSAIRALGKAGYADAAIADITGRPVAEVQGALNQLED